MKVLVLGDSDSEGRFLKGTTWPELLKTSLEARLESPVEIASVGFSAVTSTAPAYAEKRVNQHQPDVVVLLLGSFGFTAKFSWLRVKQVFGERAGRWYKAIEDSFDDNTRDKNAGRDRLNRAAHWVVPKVLPGKSLSTRAAVTRVYQEVFLALSRFEDAELIIMSYPGFGAHARQGDAPRQRKLFFADMQAAAREHHIAWVDGVKAFEGVDRQSVKSDELHFNSAGHEVMARAVEEAIVAGRAVKGGVQNS
jgi:lysophospholipase L1-like esterase